MQIMIEYGQLGILNHCYFQSLRNKLKDFLPYIKEQDLV